MGFFGFCESDPVLEFLRKTYHAVPMRMPDVRMKPLILFAVVQRRVQYLGDLTELAPAEGWGKPRVDLVDLPNISGAISQQLSWDTALDLLGPFIGEILELAGIEVEASFKLARRRGQHVRISLGRARRSFAQPLACAAALASTTIRLPLTLDPEIGLAESKPLYLVNSVLSAGELTLIVEGDTATEMAATLEADIVGKTSANTVLRSNSKLIITGLRRSTFAFTCLELQVDEARAIRGLRVPLELPRAGGATPARAITPVTHAIQLRIDTINRQGLANQGGKV